MTDSSDLPQLWQDNRDHVWHAIQRLAHADNVFWQVQAILAANPSAHQDGELSNWMAQCYSDSAVMAVRRLCDKRKGSHSLWRLLTHMSAEPTILSKGRYVGMHKSFLREYAEDWWLKLAGGDHGNIPRAKILEVRNRLERSLETISQFASRAVAHSGGKSSEPSPVWHDIRLSLCEAFECYSWVSRVFDSCDPVGAVPFYQGDWLKDLHVAWLPAESEIPSYVHLDEVMEEIRGDQSDV
jgi:hypothetical protein